jgi:translation initiation factor IF-2
LAPEISEEFVGAAEVRETFKVPKIGVIAGCFVKEGRIARKDLVRLVRDGKKIYEGRVSSLKRFKDDAREVKEGFECGIGIENFNDIKVGDTIEAFAVVETARTLQ